MIHHLWLFVGIAAVVIVVPGPDTAIVTKNALLHGRRAALGTSFGVSTGLAVWTLASALGVASIVRASDAAFTALKLIGAAYLVWLGIQALRAAGRAGPHSDDRERVPRAASCPGRSRRTSGSRRPGRSASGSAQWWGGRAPRAVARWRSERPWRRRAGR